MQPCRGGTHPRVRHIQGQDIAAAVGGGHIFQGLGIRRVCPKLVFDELHDGTVLKRAHVHDYIA
jgi:hypothetical protein